MYLKNYLVKPIDASQVVLGEACPVVSIPMHRFVDDPFPQIERRHIPLDILLYASPNEPQSRQELPWDEIRDRLDELFVHFLDSVSATWSLNTWFDLLRLLERAIPTYHLIVSSSVASQLIETGIPEEGIHGYGFPLYQHWFEIVTQPYLADTACYIIPPEYYVTYLHKYASPALQRVWVCSFIDMTGQGFQPICLEPQSVVDLLVSEPPSLHSSVAEPQADLVPVIPGALLFHSEPQDQPKLKPDGCPVCGGKLQRLNERDMFRLDCDWDNLRPIC